MANYKDRIASIDEEMKQLENRKSKPPVKLVVCTSPIRASYWQPLKRY
jgi:hypothetical protein